MTALHDFKHVADIGTVASEDGRGGYALERITHGGFGEFVAIAVERDGPDGPRRVGRIRVELAALRRVGAMLLQAARDIEADRDDTHSTTGGRH